MIYQRVVVAKPSGQMKTKSAWPTGCMTAVSQRRQFLRTNFFPISVSIAAGYDGRQPYLIVRRILYVIEPEETVMSVFAVFEATHLPRLRFHP